MSNKQKEMDHQADLWSAVRLLAEGSDWKRDEGETLQAWAIRMIKAGMQSTATNKEN